MPFECQSIDQSQYGSPKWTPMDFQWWLMNVLKGGGGTKKKRMKSEKLWFGDLERRTMIKFDKLLTVCLPDNFTCCVCVCEWYLQYLIMVQILTVSVLLTVEFHCVFRTYTFCHTLESSTWRLLLNNSVLVERIPFSLINAASFQILFVY